MFRTGAYLEHLKDPRRKKRKSRYQKENDRR